MPQIRRHIAVLRGRIIALHRLQSLASTLAALGVVVAIAGAVDYAVRWPWPVRCALLVAGMLTGWRWFRRRLLPSWRRTPSEVSVAIRMEQVEPSLVGVLASAVEFESRRDAPPDPLARQVIEEAAALWGSIRPGRHLRRWPAVRAVAAASVVLGAWVAANLAQPQLTRTLLARTLAPWTRTNWPPRVRIHGDIAAAQVARGDTILLRAKPDEGQRAVDGVRVDAVCEIRDARGALTTRTFELVAQSDGSWERPMPAEGESVTISFVVDGAETSPVTIQVIDPPAIVAAELVVAPPPYAAALREQVQMRWDGGAMPSIPSVLAGGRATLRMTLASPPAVPRDGGGAVDAAWLARTVTALDTTTGAPMDAISLEAPGATEWTLAWTTERGADITVDPVDEHGIHAAKPLRARIQVVQDQEPAVTVADPEQDEVATQKASIPVRIEAKDDLGLSSIGLRVDRQQRSGEPAPRTLATRERTIDAKEGELKSALDLASLEVRGGDTLFLRGVAQDRFEKDGLPRAPTLSEARRVRVVDQDVFEQNVRQQASSLRQSAARLETAQRDAMEEKDAANATQSQKSLSDRLEQARQTLQRLSRRLDRNGMADSALAQTLREADAQAAEAAQHSRQATQHLKRSAEGDAAAPKQASAQQKESLQAIQSMLETLDRDDDAANAQRRVGKLAETIEQLRKDLQRTAQKTAGRPAEELSADDQSQLRAQAQKQRAAAQEARAMVEDLLDRAERVRKKDQPQAQTLRSAAAEGERGDAAKHMEEAADRSERNQTGAADDSMQAAADAVDKVQKMLKADRQARSEELQRRMASLVETLRALVARAEAGRTALDAWEDAAAAARGEIDRTAELLSRNTTAAAEESRGSGRTMEATTGALDRAGEQEGAVVAALRAAPAQPDAARAASSRGLELLKEALAKADDAKKKQDAQNEAKEREDLAKKYRAFTASELRLRQDVAAIVPGDQRPLDRRATAAAREAAQRQESLRTQVAGIVAQFAVIKDAPVFLRTHALIDEWMAASREALDQTRPTPQTVDQLDQAASALESLAVALSDPEPPDDPFAQNQAAGQDGGGSGGGGGAGERQQKIPPLAEIRLVRELQAQINRRTRMIDEAGADSPGAAKAIEQLTALQNEVRALGEDWVERMKKAAKPAPSSEAAPGEKRTKPAEGSHEAPWQGFDAMARMGNAAPADDSSGKSPSPPTLPPDSAVKPPQNSAPQSPQDPAAKPSVDAPPKTLDELLGIGGGSGSGERAAEAQRKEKLEQGLKEESLNDLAEAAMNDMKMAQRLVAADRDVGIGTQRVQAQALARLDALIEAAVKFEKSQQSKSSRQKSSQSRSPSPREARPQDAGDEGGQDKDGAPKPNSSAGRASGDARRNPGDASGDQVEPPEFQDAQMQADSALDEGRAEWGRLPKRIREIMSQSRRDRISALYLRATEAYYRRMAEERGP